MAEPGTLTALVGGSGAGKTVGGGSGDCTACSQILSKLPGLGSRQLASDQH